MAISNSISGLFGDDVLGQIAQGAFETEYQKDYAHASKLFVSGDMDLMPRQKFLFHVFFTLSDPTMMTDVLDGRDNGVIGALVKTVALPSFDLSTEEYVQYNRKRLVHNRIKYNPVSMVLHDDSQDIIRSMWAKYYEYHFADSSYAYDEGIPGDKSEGKAGKTDYNNRDIYDNVRKRQAFGWGKTILHGGEGGRKQPFFKDIKIFGLSQGKFASYTLINPVISRWTHDTYDYTQGAGLMQHTAELQYEAVKYGSGDVGDVVNGPVTGLGHPSRYDKSKNDRASASIGGDGGLVSSLGSVGSDLASGNFGGALKTLGSSAQAFGSVEGLTASFTSEGKKLLTDETLNIAKDVGPLNFPSGSSSSTSTSPTPDPSEQ